MDHSRRTTRSHDRPIDGPEQLDTFVGVIRSALPDQLRLQLNTSTLRAKAEALANAGWTEQALAAAVIDREWEGARSGAVISWLTDLAKPADRGRPAKRDPRTDTLRRRVEVAHAKAVAAGPQSPARTAARQLAAQLGRRRQPPRPHAP